MIDVDVKKIVVLFVDHKTSANWSMVLNVGHDKYLVRLRDYIEAANAHPTFRGMRNVGITEIRGNEFDHIAHGTIINRWL